MCSGIPRRKLNPAEISAIYCLLQLINTHSLGQLSCCFTAHFDPGRRTMAIKVGTGNNPSHVTKVISSSSVDRHFLGKIARFSRVRSRGQQIVLDSHSVQSWVLSGSGNKSALIARNWCNRPAATFEGYTEGYPWFERDRQCVKPTSCLWPPLLADGCEFKST